MTAADRPSVTDNARAEEQSGYTVQQTAAHFARSVQRVSDRIQRTDYRRSVVDVVALESVQGFLDRIARDDLGVYAAGRAETTTATVEDAIRNEVEYRLRTTAAYFRMRGKHGEDPEPDFLAMEIAAATARLTGLLATARTRPTREQIAKRLFATRATDGAAATAPEIWDLCLDAADAVLALLGEEVGR